MGLDSIDNAVLNGRDDVTNSFDFSKWRSVPVKGIGNTGNLATVLYKMSTSVELQISNELSSLKAMDFYSTIFSEKSTGNTPKKLNTQPIYHIVTDEVYSSLEQSNAKEAMDVQSNKNSPKQLTPVTIMVVDTISSVKSRILLKVLLDSGSTSTMINRKCLPRNCQTCKISKSRKMEH